LRDVTFPKIKWSIDGPATNISVSKYNIGSFHYNIILTVAGQSNRKVKTL